jgi:uncharacterized protein
MITRRRFILGAVGITVLGGAGYGVHAARQFVVQTVPLKLAQWDGAPMRVVFLTDMHRGPYVTADYLHEIARATAELDADLLLHGGDYVYASRRYFSEALEPFARIVPPAGSWGVLGNHDHSNGAPAAREAMRRHGVGDLTNTAVKLWFNRNPLWLFGVDDYRNGRPDMAKAVKAVPKDALCIGLTHNPDLYLSAPLPVEPPLLLAGHTHGGQVRLPIIGAPFLTHGHGSAFESGQKQVGKSLVHVSRGIGTIAAPVRFNCPPEITLIIISGLAA